ncbi:hypothetical protein LQF76_12575 [Gloeomargaritales cyanobacterium VI4D9]|nr:hypothetical protein LQF76_12575 [Gloeomargaritales cyanobacterium VI4D9]
MTDQDLQRAKHIQQYLRIKSPRFTDRECEVLDQIRLLFRELDPVKQAGLVSELSRTVYDNLLDQQ